MSQESVCTTSEGESGFDEAYVESKVASQEFFEVPVEDVIVRTDVAYYQQDMHYCERLVTSFDRYVEEVVRLQNPKLADDQPLRVFLVISHPLFDERVVIDADVSFIMEFVEMEELDSGEFSVEDEVVSVRFTDENHCEIQSNGSYECWTEDVISFGWRSIESIHTSWEPSHFPADSKFTTVFKREWRKIRERMIAELREEWAKANQYYCNEGVVTNVTQDDEKAFITVLVADSACEITFCVEPPSDWSETNPVVRFVEDVGQGTVQNAETEQCFVSFEEHTGDVVASHECGLYLYVENPCEETASESSTRASEQSSILGRLCSSVPM